MIEEAKEKHARTIHVEFSPNFSFASMSKASVMDMYSCLHIFGCIQILEHLAHPRINKAYFGSTTIKTCQLCF
jgi:hypothetical protein